MTEAWSWVKYTAKAVVAAVVAGGGALAVAMADDSVNGSSISVGEWVTVGVAFLVAGAAVYTVSNAPSGVLYAAKAVAAGATAFAATFIPALADGIAAAEWMTIAGAVIVAVTGVYFVKNGEEPVSA